MPYRLRQLPFVLAPFMLFACQSAGADYPSLAIRDAERVQGTFEVAGSNEAAPQPEPLQQGTLDRLGLLVEQARRAHTQFMEAAPGARSTVSAARGSSVESDSWAAAQVALADLESTRSSAAIALGDLDLLFADATLSFTERDAIGEARETVVALIAIEDRTLAELRGGLDR